MLQQLLSLESRRRKICGGSWWNKHGLGEEQDLKFLTVSSWDQSIACWASMIRCLSVEITVWEPFRSWRKVTPSKGPRHGIWVNRRHCKFRLSPHVFCFPGLLHHCYHCSDFSSSIVSIWRLDNFFKCLVKGLSMLKNSRSTRIECQHSLFFFQPRSPLSKERHFVIDKLMKAWNIIAWHTHLPVAKPSVGVNFYQLLAMRLTT